jgi:hypothetical protein
LRKLVTHTATEKLHPAARAAAYMLTFTAQKSVGKHDLSEELLTQMRDHPDPLTNRLSEWALSFRFNERGKEHQVRPLLEGAQMQTRFPEPPRFR